MMTLRRALVLLEVPEPRGFWVCTAVMVALQYSEVMPVGWSFEACAREVDDSWPRSSEMWGWASVARECGAPQGDGGRLSGDVRS